jgi:menaquinone-dependent protoporphyrinogen oxidase
MKDATEFVKRNQSILANCPVWLFSSGPLGTGAKDAQGQDLRVVSEPKEIAEFKKIMNPRDHRVFFGGLDSSKLAFQHKMIRKMPAGRTLLPEGDFRDWSDIEGWTSKIVQTLRAHTEAE